MHAQQQEVLLLLEVAVVGVQHFADLPHDVAGLHGAGGPHTPGEAEGAGLTVLNFPFLIPRYMATGATGRGEKSSVTHISPFRFK